MILRDFVPLLACVWGGVIITAMDEDVAASAAAGNHWESTTPIVLYCLGFCSAQLQSGGWLDHLAF